jgi:hypothetical protein
MTFKIMEKEVTFDFDVNNDTPVGVAREMVKELGLPSLYVELIAKRIQ